MKKITILGIIALSAAVMAITGCCSSGSCPMKGGKDMGMCSMCGNPKGSPACAAACMKK